jgi:hypothetical protein
VTGRKSEVLRTVAGTIFGVSQARCPVLKESRSGLRSEACTGMKNFVEEFGRPDITQNDDFQPALLDGSKYALRMMSCREPSR